VENPSGSDIRQFTVRFVDDDHKNIDSRVATKFTMTRQAVHAHGSDFLVARSEAKRILARLESFAEVVLDFSGVDSIGQAFADEVFRVYATAHPGVKLTPIHANEEVNRMIRRAIAGRKSP
jgi:uncharacterized protein (DUF1330 family)